MSETSPVNSAKSDAPDGVTAEPRKGFILAYFASFLLVLLAVYGVNFAGNGNQLFPSPWRPAMSERAWKTRRFDEAAKAGHAPKVLVMGSSRVMQIQPPYVQAITGKPTFNYGVSVGGPIDFIAQLRHAIEMNATPELIVVGIDEQALSGVPNDYVLQNVAHWGLFHNLPGREELSFTGRVLGAVTPETTFASIQSLARPLGPIDPTARRAELMLADGYLIYPSRVKEKLAGKYDVKFYVERNGHSFHRNVSPSAWNVTPRKTELLRDFLALARSKNIQVRVMLLPLHPLFETMVATKPMRAERRRLLALLTQMCADAGVPFRDFTDLKTYGGDEMQFWDGLHQTPENLQRMVNVLFDLPPDKVVAAVPTDVELLNHLPAVSTLSTR